MIFKISSVVLLIFAGMTSLLLRQGLLRLLVGVQLLGVAAALGFLVFGENASSGINAGEPMSVLILIGGSVQLCLGLGLTTRLFYQKGRANMRDINQLKS